MTHDSGAYGKDEMTAESVAYEMVGEYLDSGVLPGHAYALTAARLGIPVSELVAECDRRATEILQQQRDRGER